MWINVGQLSPYSSAPQTVAPFFLRRGRDRAAFNVCCAALGTAIQKTFKRIRRFISPLPLGRVVVSDFGAGDRPNPPSWATDSDWRPKVYQNREPGPGGGFTPECAQEELLSDPVVQIPGQCAGCLIGMEASCGCHHIGRTLASLGHEVRLIPRSVREAVCCCSEIP